MAEFEIDLSVDTTTGKLDIITLHQSLTAIREWRNANQRIALNQQTKIKVYWENKSKCITVIAEGNQLWVKGYYQGPQAQGNYISFGVNEDTKYNNLGDAANASFNPNAVYNYLNILFSCPVRNGIFDHNSISPNGIPNKMAFLMCVFITSEMVRNEFLEVVFLYQDIFPDGIWVTYKLLYQNWNSMAGIIKKEIPNHMEITYIPNIVVSDVWCMWRKFICLDDQRNKYWKVFLRGVNKDFEKDVINLYDDILVKIQEKSKDSSFKEMYKIY